PRAAAEQRAALVEVRPDPAQQPGRQEMDVYVGETGNAEGVAKGRDLNILHFHNVLCARLVLSGASSDVERELRQAAGRATAPVARSARTRRGLPAGTQADRGGLRFAARLFARRARL